MRKINYLVAALLMSAAVVNANIVPVSTAQKVATNFYSQSYHKTPSNLTLVYTELSSDGQAVYYIFNVSNEAGFVIISAEDAGLPVIGSSDKGHYVIPSEHNNVGYWMNKRKNEVIAMRTGGVKATSEITSEWNTYINNTLRATHGVTSSVSPLLGNIAWDQHPYYNDMCPHNSVTGCVATAMAQIMKYWSYPWLGVSSTCYFDQPPGYQENYGKLCAKFDTSHYDWVEMPNMVTSPNNEVAKLMYDCGVSVSMDYSPSGSGAVVIGPAPSALNAYTAYFDYDPSTINGIMQSSYTTAGWVSTLENEANNGRPVQYQGTDLSLNEGHSWVCDGYNSTGQLHMNWGWSSSDDGYYTATALSAGGYNFDGDIGAIIGIRPSPTSIQSVSKNIAISVYPNPSHGEFTFEIPENLVNSQILVYNMIGQEVSSSKANIGTFMLNLNYQPKGVYLYRVLDNKGESVSTGRLVIE